MTSQNEKRSLVSLGQGII